MSGRSSRRSRPKARRARDKGGTWSLAVGSLLVLLVVGIVLARSSGTGARAGAAPTSGGTSIPYPEVLRVSVDEAKARHDAGEALLVDVRSEEDFRRGHIPGAISLPLAELEDRYRELPRDAEIITICT
ncbi:MAG: rhodanese-like domain-containing protein [Anaerolineae bacterium]|nr:rhodanese-like domain-containing protein [Anaerolineae bacterium]